MGRAGFVGYGDGAIAGLMFGKVWLRRQGKVSRWQFWVFRMNDVIGSFAGFIIGYQIGDNLPVAQTRALLLLVAWQIVLSRSF